MPNICDTLHTTWILEQLRHIALISFTCSTKLKSSFPFDLFQRPNWRFSCCWALLYGIKIQRKVISPTFSCCSTFGVVLSPEIRGDCNGAENCILSTIIRFPETKHEITGSVQEGSNGNLEMRVGLKKTAKGRVPKNTAKICQVQRLPSFSAIQVGFAGSRAQHTRQCLSRSQHPVQCLPRAYINLFFLLLLGEYSGHKLWFRAWY